MAYRDVVNALEHLILSKPKGVNVDTVPLVTFDRWSDLALAAKDTKAVHVLTGRDDPHSITTGQGVRAFSAFRYSGVLATPYQSSNVHDVTWNILLDVLVKGEISPNEWTQRTDRRQYYNELDAGIYSPGRGLLVDYLIGRFMVNPILTPVSRRDTPKAYEDLEDGESQWFERDSVDTYIRSVQCQDTTDLNYWTLLWTAGLPNSFLGWWPTTLTFTVTERVSPGVESYG